MLTAKLLKTIDLIGQLACALVPLAWGGSISKIGEGYFLLLFVLGGWQFTSFLIHLVLRKESWITPTRKIYTIALLVLGILGMLALVVPLIGLYIMLAMLYGAPVMGVFYFIISLVEWLNVRRQSVEALP